jgi:glyceraldehyde 3-phosphate dehydrogenase
MSIPLRIAINGFGRIGRVLTRIIWGDPRFELVAINSRSKCDIYAHLLKYDSIYGPWEKEVGFENNEALLIDGKRIPLHHEDEVEKAPWAGYGVDVVIESSGVFRDRVSSEKHLVAGAKHVLITAPAKDEDVSLMYALNHEKFNPGQHKIISSLSCTTTCLAPVAKSLHDAFTVKHGSLVTVHAYTNDQHLVDHPHRKDDFRRSRAGGLSIIPTKTGAAKAISKVIPELEGKLNGFALRIPTPTVSVVDFNAEVEKKTSVEEVNQALRKAAKEKFSENMFVTDKELVSVDYVKNPYGAIVDAPLTQVVDGNLVKVVAWYDNEWGYVSQVVNLLGYMGERIK